ncbi:MAG: glycosyltransferase [Eubacteriales bacterium]
MIYKEKTFVSAVFYVHNEESRIEKFLSCITDVLRNNFEKYELICVNDCCTDKTVSIIKNYFKGEHSDTVSIVNLSYYQGIEKAMNAGVDIAIGDFVFEFDSTHVDYNQDMIMELYHNCLSGYDIVSASNCKLSLGSKLFYSMFNKNANLQYELSTETFRILSRRAINRVASMSKTIPYRKAVYANCGLKTNTICYIGTDKSKHSNGSTQQRLSTAVDTMILYTDFAFKITFIFSMIMMAATLGVAVYALVVFFLKQPVAGFTTIMLVMTGSFFVLFALLAGVFKYLSVIVSIVFSKQKYVFESIEKLSR